MRFARLDKQDQVVVLDAPTVTALASTHLDFLDHRVLKFDLDTVNSISRQMSQDVPKCLSPPRIWTRI